MKKLFLLAFTVVTLNCFAQSAELKPVSYADGKQKLTGLSLAPPRARDSKPGVLILPAWYGIGDHSKSVAQKLAASGYIVFIADIYGEGNYPKTDAEAGKIAGQYKKNYADYQRRIQLALDQLVASGADANNIAMIGYCFGGTGVLEAARAGMKTQGVISFHGGLGKDASRANGPIKTKILICHGADDPFVPKADIEALQKEMNDGKADWQMIYYSGAVHAFTEPAAGNDNSKGAAYNETADKRSWRHALDFLKEILK